MDIISSRKVKRPYRNHQACCDKLWFVRSIYPNLTQMGQKIYHSMLVPCHDTKPSFMIFMRVLDLHEFKNQVCQCFQQSHDAQMFEFHSHFDLENYPRTHMWFFNQLWCTGPCACIWNLNYAQKGDTFPLRTMSLLERSSGLQEALQESATLSSATADGKGMNGGRQRHLPSAMDGKRLRQSRPR